MQVNSGLIATFLLFSYLNLDPMKAILGYSLFVLIMLNSCSQAPDAATLERWKQEIRDVEEDFADMAQREGIPQAFLYYAAEDAVLMRGDKLYMGKQELEELFAGNTSSPRDENLSWSPDFVDISASGDLGYTYGHYTYSYTDSTGANAEQTGVFHTVWKRQPDGSWRFVWD